MSWERIRELPGRKLVGVFFGGMGGFFALGFLGRSLILWRDVPSGVFELIGLLRAVLLLVPPLIAVAWILYWYLCDTTFAPLVWAGFCALWISSTYLLVRRKMIYYDGLALLGLSWSAYTVINAVAALIVFARWLL